MKKSQTAIKPGAALNPLTEMMTRVEFNRGTVNHKILRVWSIAKHGQCGPDQRIMKALGTQRHSDNVAAHVKTIMDQLGHEVVAAYELLNGVGQGFVHYPDWK
jgi:hypothetical protein